MNTNIDEILYRRYAKDLAHYGRRQWKLSEDQAWDLTYKSLLKFQEVNSEKHFENRKSEKSYLFKIYINYLKNFLRDSRQDAGEKQGAELADVANQSEEINAESFELSLIKDILDSYEDWERILLLLRQQNVPYSTISKYVNKPEKNLKVYYSRLKERLKKDLFNQLKNRRAS